MIESTSLKMLKATSREELETFAFLAVAALRSVVKGEGFPVPKGASRTDITKVLLQVAKKATSEINPAPVFNDEVTDVSEAADLLKKLAGK